MADTTIRILTPEHAAEQFAPIPDAAPWSASADVSATDQAALPDGSTGVRVAEAAAQTRASFDGVESAAWHRVPSKIGALELVPGVVFGHSWGNGGPDIPTGARYVDRISARQKLLSLNNLAVAGTRMDQILGAVQSGWVPNSRGLVLFADGVINDVVQYTDASGIPTTTEAFRSALALLTSANHSNYNDTCFAYGLGWTAGAATAAGSYVDFAFTGDSAWLQVGFVTGAGGTFTVKNAAGATVATITTGGYKQNFTGSTLLSGFGAGTHSVRITLTSGTSSITGAVNPSATPPLISWMKSGPRGTGDSSIAMVVQYQQACAPIAALFASVVPADMDAFWDQTTMVGPGFHPNELGMFYIANLVERSLASAIHRQGLNQLVTSTAGSPYTVPAPDYVGPGATVPAAPTSLVATTGQLVNLVWTRGADGGATITSQIIQASPHGTNTWATVAKVAGSVSSATVATGLPAATSYDFQVIPVNDIGQGPASNTSTATTGTPLVTYAQDNFNRADNPTVPGALSGGTYTWAVSAGGTLGIASNRLACTLSSTYVAATIDDGHADGTWQVTGATGQGVGLYMNASTLTDGYAFIALTNGSYDFRKRTAAGTWTSLGNSTATVPAGGNVLTVVKVGTTFTCKVNGTTLLTITDATYTGTKSGVIALTGSTPIFDDWSHTSAQAV